MAIPAAIRKSMAITKAHLAMKKKPAKKKAPRGSARGRRAPDLEAAARAIVDLLEGLGVRWTVVGAAAYSVLVEPRATEDLDVVVEADKLGVVLDALSVRFGKIETTDIGAAVRVKEPRLDLIPSSTHALFRAALDHVRVVNQWRVPTPEMFIALKFLAAVSSWRARKRKAQDVVDLVGVYTHYGRAALDMDVLMKLAGQVYPSAERELLEMLRRIDSDEPISI